MDRLEIKITQGTHVRFRAKRLTSDTFDTLSSAKNIEHRFRLQYRF